MPSRGWDPRMLTEHDIELRVRYNETDPMGYVHNANYFSYFEIGRTELLRQSGGRSPERQCLRVVSPHRTVVANKPVVGVEGN